MRRSRRRRRRKERDEKEEDWTVVIREPLTEDLEKYI